MSVKRSFLLLFLLTFAMACAAVITFLVVLEMNPKLNSSEQDEQENSRIIQEDRDRLNRQIGMKAFRKLEEKYGCDSSNECYIGEQ